MSAKKRAKRPNKKSDILKLVRTAVSNGVYRDLTKHAAERSKERRILRTEIEYVLKNGWHEKVKDSYDERHKSWNYAIRGQTVDEKNLRVIVSFDEENLMIITVIDLEN